MPGALCRVELVSLAGGLGRSDVLRPDLELVLLNLTFVTPTVGLCGPHKHGPTPAAGWNILAGRGGVVVGIVGSPRPAKYVNVQVIRDVLEDVFVLRLMETGGI